MPQNITCANPQCGAVFEVPDGQADQTVQCPECGSPVTVTGGAAGAEGLGKVGPESFAPVRVRRKRDWTPFIIGGAVGGALLVLIVLVVVAVKLVGKRREEAQLAQEQQAQQEAPAQQTAVAEPEPEGPRVVLTEADFGTLGQQEQAIAQAVEDYKVRLRDVLTQAKTAAPGATAELWADLYAFCRDNDLGAEADAAWMRAVLLRPRDPSVNAKLGRTASFADVPVTPEQKQFLETLRPAVQVRNLAVELSDHVVRVAEQEALPFGWADSPEFRVEAGSVRVQVTPSGAGGSAKRQLELQVQPGLTYTITFRDASGSPQIAFGRMARIYNAFSGTGEAENVFVEQDWQGQVTSLSIGDVRVTGTENAPLSMTMGRQNVLTVTGLVTEGDPYSRAGQKVFWGNKDQPLGFNVDARERSVSLVRGTSASLRIDLSDGLWGVLGTAQGDLANKWAQSRLARRAARLGLKTAAMEAAGELAAPWRGLEYSYEEMLRTRSEIMQAVDYMDRAAWRTSSLDNVRALGIQDRAAYLYLNWPRYREALAALTADGWKTILGRAGLAEPKSAPDARPRRTLRADVAHVGRRRAGPQESSEIMPRAVTLEDSARPYVLMKMLAILPDDVAVQKVRENWDAMDKEARTAAIVALEKVATPAAVDLLGDLSRTSDDLEMVTAALMALGAIGTPEALRHTDEPGVVGAVRMASLAAKAIAGDPDTLENLQSTLAAASEGARARFLTFAADADTPATLLVLSTVADLYSGAEARGKILQALARMGGRSAMAELVRLTQADANLPAALLRHVSQEDAPVLVRTVGNAVAQGGGDQGAVDFLMRAGGQAGRAFVHAAAANLGSKPAAMALLKEGSAESIAAAADGAAAVQLGLLEAFRKELYAVHEETGEWAWVRPVDPRAAGDYLHAVMRDNSDARVQLTAARMLSEIGQKPDVQILLSLAEEREQKAQAPEGRRGRRRAAGGGAPPVEEFGPPVGFGASGVSAYAPPGYSEPTGKPRMPKDFKLDGPTQLYALGLLSKVAEEREVARLRDLVDAYESAQLRTAAVHALALIGGAKNLQLVRDRATARVGAYAKAEDVMAELRERVAALDALGEAQDADFLPQLLDVLNEEAPSEDAIADVKDYADLSAWWQIRLREEACKALVGICRTKQMFELTADSSLQQQMTQRLLELIETPGPDSAALSAPRRLLKARALRAYARCASPYEEDTLLVMKRIALTLPDEGKPGRTVFVHARYGGPSKFKPRDTVRKALRDAVVTLATRGAGLNALTQVRGTLPRAGQPSEAWSAMVKRMAAAPPAQYFALVNTVYGSLTDEARQAIFDVTQGKVDSYDSDYALFVARMIRNPVRDKGEEDRIEAATATYRPEIAVGPPPEVLAMIAEEEEALRGAGVDEYDDGVSVMRTRQPQVVKTRYARRGPRRKAKWSYSLKGVGAKLRRLRRKWQTVELLLGGSPSAVAAAIEQQELCRHAEFGPEIAVRYAALGTGGREQLLASLRDTLVGAEEVVERTVVGPGPGAVRATARRQASVAARRAGALVLRRLGGEDAAELLYDALVGPRIVIQADTPGRPMGRMMRPDDLTEAYGRGGGVGVGVRERSGGEKADPGGVYLARALGGLGRGELLRQALSAQDRTFFSERPLAVQKAALEGMAFLPDERQALTLLSDLLRLASTADLKKAVSDAIASALERLQLG